MSIANFDKTLEDTTRRDINLKEYQVESVLPDYIQQEYPKFVTFLKKYFEFEDREGSVTRFLQDMFELRDVTQTDLDLLKFFEDEFLLGQNYFQGFDDKRTAIKYSNYLYRSKGTRYSIRQFFKTFFSIEPDVVYTKQYIFTLQDSSGEGSKVGAESARYLTDNKLYQTYAIQIRSELSVSQWRDAYKLLVHPAGMYLGGLTQIVGEASLDQLQYDPGKPIKPPVVIEGIGDFQEAAFAQHTALFNINNPTDPNGDVIKFRANMGSPTDYPNPGGNDIQDVADLTINQVDRLYSSVAEYLTPDSPTLDEDSDGTTTYAGFDISSTETIDQDVFTWNPAINRVDSDHSSLLDIGGSLLAVGDSDSEITLREILDGNF